jgi:hypothetical protein
MGKKDNIWHDNELKKLKKEKKEALGDKDDYSGTSSEVKYRKKIKEEYKKERRRIKRAEKNTWKQEVEEEINKSEKN